MLYSEGMKFDPANHPFKSRSFFKSLGYALNGIQLVFSSERNFRKHVLIAIVVAGMGWYYRVEAWEWAILLLCMAMMMAIESLNTALEYLVDAWSEGIYREKAKQVKDIAAGACLITAVGASLTGLCIFWPRWFH